MADNETAPRSLGQLLHQLDAQGIRDYRRYQAVHRYLDMKARAKGVPLTGTFELTPLCNLDCKMCYVHMHRAVTMSTAQWLEILRQAVEAGMLYARLTGGECLTHPGFREIYLYLQERGVEIGVLTNGVLLDEDMVAFFAEHKPAMIQITLYGASEDGYERVTGHRCFQRVMDSIQALRDAQIPVAVVTTPNTYMTDGEEIVQLLHAKHLPVTINAGLLAPREETGRTLQDAPLEMYVRMMRRHRALYDGGAATVTPPEDLPGAGGTGEKVCGVTCGAGRSSFSIDWHGRMRPCNNFPCTGEGVLQSGFAEAWRNTHTTAAHFPQPGECQGCRYQGVCKHCVAEHAAGAPIGHASPAICAWGRRMIAEGLRVFPASGSDHEERRNSHEEGL